MIARSLAGGSISRCFGRDTVPLLYIWHASGDDAEKLSCTFVTQSFDSDVRLTVRDPCSYTGDKADLKFSSLSEIKMNEDTGGTVQTSKRTAAFLSFRVIDSLPLSSCDHLNKVSEHYEEAVVAICCCLFVQKSSILFIKIHILSWAPTIFRLMAHLGGKKLFIVHLWLIDQCAQEVREADSHL